MNELINRLLVERQASLKRKQRKKRIGMAIRQSGGGVYVEEAG